MHWARSKAILAVGTALLLLFFLPSCTVLSNKNYVRQYPQYQGIRRVAVFIQRWPCYQQLPNQNDLGSEFINQSTRFAGPWQPAGLINPRAVDIQDINDELMADLLTQVLTGKGYQPFISGVFPVPADSVTVREIMAQCQAVDPWVEACLFCFYSPVVFCSEATGVPKDWKRRPYGLQELIQTLNPGGDDVIWAGPRAAQAPSNSISHAFIYVSMTLFKALDWRPLWEVADSQLGGLMRVNLAQCLPGPTDQDYPADAAIIQRLMTDNLTCRLNHLIPDAF